MFVTDVTLWHSHSLSSQTCFKLLLLLSPSLIDAAGQVQIQYKNVRRKQFSSDPVCVVCVCVCLIRVTQQVHFNVGIHYHLYSTFNDDDNAYSWMGDDDDAMAYGNHVPFSVRTCQPPPTTANRWVISALHTHTHVQRIQNLFFSVLQNATERSTILSWRVPFYFHFFVFRLLPLLLLFNVWCVFIYLWTCVCVCCRATVIHLPLYFLFSKYNKWIRSMCVCALLCPGINWTKEKVFCALVSRVHLFIQFSTFHRATQTHTHALKQFSFIWINTYFF